MATSKNKQPRRCKHQSPWSRNGRPVEYSGMESPVWFWTLGFALNSCLYLLDYIGRQLGNDLKSPYVLDNLCWRHHKCGTRQTMGISNSFGDLRKQNSKIHFFVYHYNICTSRELPYSQLSWRIIDALLPGDWLTTFGHSC